MMDFLLNCKFEDSLNIEFDSIANAFAEEDSRKQAILLHELFDALRHLCKDHFRNESQLLHIADAIKEHNFKHLIYSIKTLNSFIEDEK